MKKPKYDFSGYSCQAIDSQSVNIDWQERLGGNLDGYRTFEAVKCDKCGKILVLNYGDGEDKHCNLDFGSGSTTKCTGWVDRAEGPMMNYYYPVEIRDCEEAAKLLIDIPLCVVAFDDGTTALALQGGGMDMRWSICEAFLAFEMLPPLAFCDLPDFAGGTNARMGKILAACIETCKVAAASAARTKERLEAMAKRRGK